MAEICLLDHGTIDKIAAGEVVERPFSVVKELVENAVDAGADAITVEIKEGGISLIRVTDNGSGIEKAQVARAFFRHATSKIRSAQDLIHVTSLGFRGEALSSISSVSQTEMITKTQDELTGVRFLMEGGKETGLEEIGAPKGTTILVRNLFFNIPARRKFLKSAATEGSYISDLLEHMALSLPHVSFEFIQNNQTKFHTSGNGDLKEIIYRIYGKDITKELIVIDVCEGNRNLTGFIARPFVSRSNRNYENYFVNGRYIKSELIAKAIETGYRSCMMQHKFPFTVLNLLVPSDTIDVNVHPAKMDIRFMEQSEIFDFLSRQIEHALKEEELIPQISIADKTPKENHQKITTKSPEPFEVKRKQITRSEPKQEISYAVDDQPAAKCVRETDHYHIIPDAAKQREDISEKELQIKEIKKEGKKLPAPVETEQLHLFEERFLSEKARESYRILGQLFSTYWLLGYSDKLYIVDQHAAHEKVKYERLLERIRTRENISQLLNPPIILTLTSAEIEVEKKYHTYFRQMGFEAECFGGSEYTLRSVPVDLFGCNEKSLFLEILDELAEDHPKAVPSIIEEKIASMACKAAVKGNMPFDENGIRVLLDELFTLENPYHCPHGRPTIIAFTKYEIEKKFKRIL